MQQDIFDTFDDAATISAPSATSATLSSTPSAAALTVSAASPTPPAQSGRLSRELILTQALAMADEQGIENVSVRKLAAALGKTPMALYRYFDSAEELLQNAVALAFREVDTAPIPGERWDDTLRRTMSSIRDMELRHAHAHLFKVEGSAWSPQLIEHTNRVQNLHRAQGIPEDILMKAWRIVDAFLTGFLCNEIGEMENATPAPEGDAPEWIETTAGAYSTQAFFDGIEIIIAGIRSLAAPDPCEWYTPDVAAGAEGPEGPAVPEEPNAEQGACP